jgi:hypothetical protein
MTKKKSKPVPAPTPEADLLLAEEPATTPVGTLEPTGTAASVTLQYARFLTPEEKVWEQIKIINERLLALETANAKPEKPKAICVQEPCQP